MVAEALAAQRRRPATTAAEWEALPAARAAAARAAAAAGEEGRRRIAAQGPCMAQGLAAARGLLESQAASATMAPQGVPVAPAEERLAAALMLDIAEEGLAAGLALGRAEARVEALAEVLAVVACVEVARAQEAHAEEALAVEALAEEDRAEALVVAGFAGGTVAAEALAAALGLDPTAGGLAADPLAEARRQATPCRALDRRCLPRRPWVCHMVQAHRECQGRRERQAEAGIFPEARRQGTGSGIRR